MYFKLFLHPKPLSPTDTALYSIIDNFVNLSFSLVFVGDKNECLRKNTMIKCFDTFVD